jgi:hypothetical protein
MAAMVVPLFSWPSTSQITAIFKDFSLFLLPEGREARKRMVIFYRRVSHFLQNYKGLSAKEL